MTVQAPGEPDFATLLSRLDQLRQAERRAASARMVSMVGHLIGTPLNVIAGRAGLIRTSTTPEGVEENARRIEEQVERLSLRIRRLIDYFSMADAEPQPRTVSEVLAECLALYRPIAQQKGLALEVDSQVGEGVRIDGSLGPVVLTTLLSLATRTTQSGGLIKITATERTPKAIVFELILPGLSAPPGPLDKLEPPEYGVRYDAGALETLWICNGLARRIGGGLELTSAAPNPGVTLRVVCSPA